MNTTTINFEGICRCREAAGKPARVTVKVEGQYVSATCETHGAWPYLSAANHAEVMAHARELASEVASPDGNVEAVRAKLLERSKRGMAKYGTTTERGDLSLRDWLVHMQEELLDGAVYAQAALSNAEPAACPTCEGTGLANVVDQDDGALVLDDCPECGGESRLPAPEASRSDAPALYAQLLNMLGAKDQSDAARIIAGHHARELDAAQPAQAGEAVAPFAYIYEWDCETGVVHRSLRQAPYNGQRCDRVHAVYLHPQPEQAAVSEEDDVERVAGMLYEYATDEPWTVSGLHYSGQELDEYRSFARRIVESFAQRMAGSGERDAVDAARYRWLRENAHAGFMQSGRSWAVLSSSTEFRTWEQCDAAIDAAIAQQSDKRGGA